MARHSASQRNGSQFVIEMLEDRRLLSAAPPQIVLTDADFDRVRTEVNAGANPWLSGWNALTSDGYAQLGATPRPLATVIRGGDGQNFNQMVIDIQRTYELAIRWKISGDTRYADLAVTFLNSWASTMTTLTGNSDRFLASGLYGYDWAAAADIMRSYSGWAASDVTAFQNYLLNIYYPMQHDFLVNHNGAYITNYWANWDLANVEGMMGVGLFTGRQDLYDEAMNYLYTGGGNGALDKIVYYLHPGHLAQWQESGRDQGHTVLGMQLFGHIAQMAWNQGTDLFTYNDNQFLAAAEYVAKYNLGYDVPYETYSWGTGQSGAWQTQTVISTGSRGDLDVGYELIYGHYAGLMGMAAPYSHLRMLARGTEGRGSGDEMGFGTLLFSQDLPITPVAPRGLTAIEKGTGNIRLDWFGGANDTSYNVYRATSANGIYAQVATGISDLLSYTDANLPAGVYYYKVTGVGAAGETAASNIVNATAYSLLQTQLRFNETTGTAAADSSGNGHTGTLNGGATWTAGQWSNAVSLNGTDGYVSLPTGITADVSDFTIAAWVNLNAASTWSRIFDFGDSRGRWMFLTPRNNNGVVEFSTSTVYGYNKQSVVGTAALLTNQWVHVAVTFADRTATLYVNGVAVGSNSNMDFPPFEIGSTTRNWIGRSQFSADPYLNGKVDDFRIYRGALTASDVSALATATPPATPAGVVGVSGNQSATLSWNTATGATTYNVRRASVAGGPYTTVAKGLTTTSFTDAGLTNGTAYYYTVTAENLADEGPASAEVKITPFSLFTTQLDTGNATNLPGSFSVANGVYTVKGAGSDIWGTADNFHYVYIPFSGDGQIIARVASIQNTNSWAKAGLLFRESLAANAKNAFVAVTPGNGIAFQRRTSTGGTSTSSVKTGVTAPYWLKLVRSGNVFQAFYSATGTSWTQLGSSTTIAMAGSIYVGLAVTSHNSAALASGVFDNIAMTPYTNLALKKTATATSTASGSAAANAVDGSTSTAWTSAAGGSQTFTVDLGAVRALSHLVLNWGSPYATSYSVQISSNASTWTTVYSTLTGAGGTVDVAGLLASARYVRLVLNASSASSYSLKELNVFGV